ncbi:MAG: hypothetical protein H6812_01515 [Phycisphaeraceae bacterium]|nr:hypothetical protein [Phycisphaerales bacterium]MCA9306716.1 hypothetical protein [Phycisphaerales bacterium]MCB9841913.1 hypothetical protein [Phycisphaeraceae bacterium]
MSPLSERVRAVLSPREGGIEMVDGLVVVRVDSVDRRYRDAIKAGLEPMSPPEDEVGMGACRRVARVRDMSTGRMIVIWSP